MSDAGGSTAAAAAPTAPKPRPPPGPPPKDAKSVRQFYLERGKLPPLPRVATEVPPRLAQAFAAAAMYDNDDGPVMGRSMLMSCLLGREAQLKPCKRRTCSTLVTSGYCYKHVRDEVRLPRGSYVSQTDVELASRIVVAEMGAEARNTGAAGGTQAGEEENKTGADEGGEAA